MGFTVLCRWPKELNKKESVSGCLACEESFCGPLVFRIGEREYMLILILLLVKETCISFIIFPIIITGHIGVRVKSWLLCCVVISHWVICIGTWLLFSRWEGIFFKGGSECRPIKVSHFLEHPWIFLVY